MKKEEITNEMIENADRGKLDEILSVYRNIYSGLSVVTESIIQLGKLDLVDADIEKINETMDDKAEELRSIVSDVNYWRDQAEEIFKGLV